MTMADWCLEHPWMTFFIGVQLAYSVGKLVRIRITTRAK